MSRAHSRDREVENYQLPFRKNGHEAAVGFKSIPKKGGLKVGKLSTRDKVAENILYFLRRNPSASIQQISIGIDLPEPTVSKRIRALRRAGRLKRVLRVIDKKDFFWYLVTVVPDLRQLQARAGSGGVSTFAEYGEHIFRLCWDNPSFRGVLLIKDIWQNQGGSFSRDGTMVDGMTFLIQARDLAVAGEFRDFLVSQGSIQSSYFIALFPITGVLPG